MWWSVLTLLPCALTPFLAESAPAAAVSVAASGGAAWLALPAGSSLASAAPAPLQSDEPWDFSYSFIEVGATRLDLDEIDDTADTYYARGSLGLFDLAYVFLGYENLSTDFDDADSDLWRLGVGAHLDLNNDLDLTGDVAWLYSDLSGDTLDEDSNGHEVRLGARWMPIHFPAGGGLEIEGHAIWIGLDDSYFSDDDTTGFDVGARVHFLRAFSVGAVYTLLEDDDQAAIHARLSF